MMKFCDVDDEEIDGESLQLKTQDLYTSVDITLSTRIDYRAVTRRLTAPVHAISRRFAPELKVET